MSLRAFSSRFGGGASTEHNVTVFGNLECAYAKAEACNDVHIQRADRGRWHRLFRTFDDANYQQLWEYTCAMAEGQHARADHVVVLRGAEPIGIAGLRVWQLPCVGGGLAYLTGGPLVRRGDKTDIERVRACLVAVVREYVVNRRMVLRLKMPLADANTNCALRECVKALGFVDCRNACAYRTSLVDIQKPSDEIRMSLHQKWRNCLNAAARNELRAVVGRERALFEQFKAMFQDMVLRKAIRVKLDAQFFMDLQERVPMEDQFLVSIIENRGEPLAGSVTAIHGDTAVYLLGASTRRGNEMKASYLLQWQVIQEAQRRGARWYDLGGIDPIGNPGVHHFKKGLGGVEVEAVQPCECAPEGIHGFANRITKALRLLWQASGR